MPEQLNLGSPWPEPVVACGRPAPTPASQAAAVALRRHALRLADRCRPAGARYLGTWPLFAHCRLMRGPQRDWAVVNLADDPLMGDPDGFPIPAAALRQLREVARSGAAFDAIYIAHELAPGAVRPGQRLPAALVVPGASAASRAAAGLLGRLSGALWALPAAIAGAAGGLGRGLAAAPRAVAALDPVVLGAVVAPGRPVAPGELAAWFALAHWAYEEEV